jgi:hypothetical protein
MADFGYYLERWDDLHLDHIPSGNGHMNALW